MITPVHLKFEERIVGYLLINHNSPEEYDFTNLTVAGRGNIEVLASQHIKNLCNDGTNRRVEEFKVLFLEKLVGGLRIIG